MTDSGDGERLSAPGAGQERRAQPSFTPARPPSSPARTPTQGPGSVPPGEGSLAHPATEAAQPQPADAPGWERTAAATGGPRPGGTGGHGQAGPRDSPTATGQSPRSAEVRYGRGAPEAAPAGAAAAGEAGVSAEEVWRTGRLPARPPRRGRRRRAGTALTAVLLIACGVVIYLRLHHAPLTVTGVAITSQVKNGCTVDVTGRIGTSGVGTVAYQWVFTPQTAPPQPRNQSVTAGQPAVYVTVAVQGTGHGQAAQQVTLQVLGPRQGSATAHVNISC